MKLLNLLDPDLIQSLINYNSQSINTTPIPTVNNYSQQDLIDIITKDLSAKDKKQFIDSIGKNNIKEITTVYLVFRILMLLMKTLMKSNLN